MNARTLTNRKDLSLFLCKGRSPFTLTSMSGLHSKKHYGSFVFLEDPPWFDAWGVAIGLFVALGIPIGRFTAAKAIKELIK